MKSHAIFYSTDVEKKSYSPNDKFQTTQCCSNASPLCMYAEFGANRDGKYRQSSKMLSQHNTHTHRHLTHMQSGAQIQYGGSLKSALFAKSISTIFHQLSIRVLYAVSGVLFDLYSHDKCCVKMCN